MNEVFVSYSREDSELAERIVRDLENAGLKVFYDQKISAGEDWDSRLRDEIERSKHTLVLLSPSYLRSNKALMELEGAAVSESEGAARLIPLLIQDTEIPLMLRHKQYADFRGNYEPAIEQLVKALKSRQEPPREIRDRKRRRAKDLIWLWVSMLGAAASAMSSAVAIKALDWSVIGTVLLVVGGLTALVAAISRFRTDRQSGRLYIVSRSVERAYVDALDASSFNPIRAREIRRG